MDRPADDSPAVEAGGHDVLARGRADLVRRFGPALGEDTVTARLEDSLQELARAGTAPGHLETVAVRFAESRLQALAESAGHVADTAPRVLFVCVQNAGRSQLAAALLAERAGDAVRVESAGSRPAAAVHDTVAPILAGHGVEDGEAFPKPVTAEITEAADLVITLGCGDACEVPPTTEVRDWPVGDPVEADWERLQEIVADIEARVDALWEELRARLEA